MNLEPTHKNVKTRADLAYSALFTGTMATCWTNA